MYHQFTSRCHCDSAKEQLTCCGINDVKIFSNGSCVWYREFQLSISHCPLDITWFPFDDQDCNLTYESKTHESRELNFSRLTPSVVLDYYDDNGEWELLGKAQIPLVASRHDTTRYLAHAFWHKKKVVMCCVALVGQCSATRSSRGLGGGRHVHFTFSKSFT